MKLPEYVLFCLNRLEEKGYPCYAVGGCVRDALLGLTPHDYDLCTAATPQVMKEIFSDHSLVLSGEKHGTVGVIREHQVVEITTFRQETGYSDSRHPDSVAFVNEIEEDLARRDFTVNAMAYSPSRGLCDPFGGRKDLKKKILRTVGDPEKRFQEDALRILRGARFSIRYGLKPEDDTLRAMFALRENMDSLARERVFEELCKLLPLATGDQLLLFAPIITQVIPALRKCVGFDQRNKHHVFDVYTHIAHVCEAVDGDIVLRWAALLHDAGKPDTFALDEKGTGHFYGHAKVSARIANETLRNLKAPTALRERVVLLIEQHMTPLEPDRKLLRRRLSRWGESATRQLLALQKADRCGKGVFSPEKMARFSAVGNLLDQLVAESSCLTLKSLAVNGHDLMALGYTGSRIGEILNSLLQQVVDETLPNEKTALLQAVKDTERK